MIIFIARSRCARFFFVGLPTSSLFPHTPIRKTIHSHHHPIEQSKCFGTTRSRSIWPASEERGVNSLDFSPRALASRPWFLSQIEPHFTFAVQPGRHSGRKSQRRQSQILLASMRSFFFFAAAMAPQHQR